MLRCFFLPPRYINSTFIYSLSAPPPQSIQQQQQQKILLCMQLRQVKFKKPKYSFFSMKLHLAWNVVVFLHFLLSLLSVSTSPLSSPRLAQFPAAVITCLRPNVLHLWLIVYPSPHSFSRYRLLFSLHFLLLGPVTESASIRSLFLVRRYCLCVFWVFGILGFFASDRQTSVDSGTLWRTSSKKHVATSLPLLLGSNPHVPQKLFWGTGHECFINFISSVYQFMHASPAHVGQSHPRSWPRTRLILSLLQWLFVQLLLKCVSVIILLALIESEPPPVSKRKYQTCLTVLIPCRAASPTIANEKKQQHRQPEPAFYSPYTVLSACFSPIFFFSLF